MKSSRNELFGFNLINVWNNTIESPQNTQNLTVIKNTEKLY